MRDLKDTCRIAVVQAAPVMFDKDGCVDKVLRYIDECAAEEKYSFRRDVLNGMGDKLNIRAYVWNGLAAQVRTVKEYFDRSMDLLEPRTHRELSTSRRPIRATEDDETPTYIAPGSRCVNSLIADGCNIAGTVENSIVFPGVTVAEGATVKNSVLFKGVKVEENASVSYVIADKHVTIRRGGKLVGHENYPMAIVKNSTI